MSVVQMHCLACGTPMQSAQASEIIPRFAQARVTVSQSMAFCTNCKAVYGIELVELRPPQLNVRANVNT